MRLFVALLMLPGAFAVAAGSPEALAFERFAMEILAGLDGTREVNLSSHPRARMYPTRLRAGAAKGANFAGRYALVTWGCGNECQGSLIIDLTLGTVLGVGGEREVLHTSRGLEFHLDSRLLIADPPCPEGPGTCLSYGRAGLPVRYYLIENGGLRLIGETPVELPR